MSLVGAVVVEASSVVVGAGVVVGANGAVVVGATDVVVVGLTDTAGAFEGVILTGSTDAL